MEPHLSQALLGRFDLRTCHQDLLQWHHPIMDNHRLIMPVHHQGTHRYNNPGDHALYHRITMEDPRVATGCLHLPLRWTIRCEIADFVFQCNYFGAVPVLHLHQLGMHISLSTHVFSIF
jgi:hypothetical protein